MAKNELRCRHVYRESQFNKNRCIDCDGNEWDRIHDVDGVSAEDKLHDANQEIQFLKQLLEKERNEKDVKEASIRIGDWVRFYQNGALIIGRVEYIRDEGHGLSGLSNAPFSFWADKKIWHVIIQTDAGEVNSKNILEKR